MDYIYSITKSRKTSREEKKLKKTCCSYYLKQVNTVLKKKYF